MANGPDYCSRHSAPCFLQSPKLHRHSTDLAPAWVIHPWPPQSPKLHRVRAVSPLEEIALQPFFMQSPKSQWTSSVAPPWWVVIQPSLKQSPELQRVSLRVPSGCWVAQPFRVQSPKAQRVTALPSSVAVVQPSLRQLEKLHLPAMGVLA